MQGIVEKYNSTSNYSANSTDGKNMNLKRENTQEKAWKIKFTLVNDLVQNVDS